MGVLVLVFVVVVIYYVKVNSTPRLALEPWSLTKLLLGNQVWPYSVLLVIIIIHGLVHSSLV